MHDSLIEVTITVDGSLLLSGAEEDAPLAKVSFSNEWRQLTDETKFSIGRAIMVEVLGASSLSDLMGD